MSGLHGQIKRAMRAAAAIRHGARDPVNYITSLRLERTTGAKKICSHPRCLAHCLAQARTYHATATPNPQKLKIFDYRNRRIQKRGAPVLPPVEARARARIERVPTDDETTAASSIAASHVRRFRSRLAGEDTAHSTNAPHVNVCCRNPVWDTAVDAHTRTRDAVDGGGKTPQSSAIFYYFSFAGGFSISAQGRARVRHTNARCKKKRM